jgi:hypothetical protein
MLHNHSTRFCKLVVHEPKIHEAGKQRTCVLNVVSDIMIMNYVYSHLRPRIARGTTVAPIQKMATHSTMAFFLCCEYQNLLFNLKHLAQWVKTKNRG